ncbi:MAG: indolepyruvate oxidoreductase subunit beta [Deltaproteobacteria bacterium]|nr:indolepyruvate oxidoreductase subunit beta [Deltaproteobacteria bacterium]
MTKSIMLTGVGGQGTILASKLLSMGLAQAGYDVKMSEIHGMSQRGGDVSSQVRYGKVVNSPVIEKGGADLLVAFEEMEAMRSLPYLKPDGKAVINKYKINPMPVVSGVAEYPEGIADEIAKKVSTTVIDAAGKAAELGNPKVMNVILLGSTVEMMGLNEVNWEQIIKDNVKPKFVELNIKAFEAGRQMVRK